MTDQEFWWLTLMTDLNFRQLLEIKHMSTVFGFDQEQNHL